jgi:mono/diheme cytochrome c family protein
MNSGFPAAVLLSLLPGFTLFAQRADLVPSEKSGADLYRTACAACHGADGKGSPQSTVGFDTPLPDFADCGFATPEPDADWMAVVHEGGRVRAFDRRMPAFGEALSQAEIERILGYIRGFCNDRRWPRGELNLPRPLITEKAFPENEAVLTTTIVGGRSRRIGAELLYERRFGARSQFEIAVPFELHQAENEWRRGIGDVAAAVKHAFFHSFETGTIVSAAGELVVPSGKESAGLGIGTVMFEPFAAVGQVLPADAFLQFQAGLELPADRDREAGEAFWRAAIGRSFFEGRFGRSWSPMIEVLGARELAESRTAVWDVVPQMQVTLSRRQHVMISAGIRIPVNQRSERPTEVLTYLLWDWFDGGFFDGWR